MHPNASVTRTQHHFFENKHSMNNNPEANNTVDAVQQPPNTTENPPESDDESSLFPSTDDEGLQGSGKRILQFSDEDISEACNPASGMSGDAIIAEGGNESDSVSSRFSLPPSIGGVVQNDDDVMDESVAADNHNDKSVSKANPRFADQYDNYYRSQKKRKKTIHKSNDRNEWGIGSQIKKMFFSTGTVLAKCESLGAGKQHNTSH